MRLLHNFQSPADLVMLTAAVCNLHRHHLGLFHAMLALSDARVLTFNYND